MSRSALQPDHAAPVIQELLEWVPKHCINGTNGPSATPNRPFMPLPDLEAYLKAESRTSNLLRALYFERDHRVVVEILERCYIRVFTILTLIGKGRYIERFVEHHNLRDHRLPFLEKPAHFPTDPNDPTFWNSFYNEQFAFCAHHFRYNETYTMLEDFCILPIISKELLGQGGSAAIYKIKLISFYDKLNPDANVSRAYSARPANTYVLKTYNTKDATNYYNSEVSAFKKVSQKNDESLIQFLGSYRQGDTYNILLEYADRGTLEDFFQNATPPSLGEDIVMFWERLFNVIQALSRIHSTERPDGFHGPDILIGWHQDVKPSNILILSGKSSDPYDVEFKLADLGLSHFKRTTNLDRRIADRDIGGTKDYGAPECHRSDEFLERSKLNVKPSIDIWSFGGVCSEAAVWVVLGMAGLTDYRGQRQQEICEKGTSQDGSCFHDGENVLNTVDAMHDRLLNRGEVRPGDHVTGPVLELMVASMLEEDPDGRCSAIFLWKKSRKILRAAQSKLKESKQQTIPRQEDAIKAQFYGLNIAETPPSTSYGAVEPYSGNSHVHGPPPNQPQFSSNPQLSGRSLSVKQTLRRPSDTRRSDTWHQNTTKPDITPVSLHGSPSPPIANYPPLGANSPFDVYSVSPEKTDRATAFDETATSHGEQTWPNVNPLNYSPSSVSRDMNPLEILSVQHQGICEFSSPETESGARVHLTEQTQSNAGPAPVPYVNNDPFGPPLESNPRHSKVAGVSTGHRVSRPVTSIMSGEASQKSTPPPSPMANTVAAEPLAQNPKPKKPYLSYEDAKQIRERRGVLSPEQQGHLNDLKDRDHVFLMDDSLSMKAHWEDLISLFTVFAYFAKRLDNNGLEMYFTVSEDKKTFKNTTPAVSHLKTMSQSTHSNIDMRLDRILRDYQTNLERQKERNGFWSRAKAKAKPVKPLSLYVFTDGTWPNCDAIAPIETMIEKLKKLGLPKEQVGIQFIRFGDDQTGIDRLVYLDSGLRKKYTKRWDIVDTEPFHNGNLLKMLLGAISYWFDSDDDEPD